MGDAKLLMHKKKGGDWLVLRQEKTKTVVCNFYVMNVAQYCVQKPGPYSEVS